MEELQAKKDCFAYRNKDNKEECNALTKMFCKCGNGKCSFYKTEKQYYADCMKLKR